MQPEYHREHHKRIARILSSMDADYFLRNEVFFGGGTAISLLLNEYRTSVDIDFMVASQDGYRAIRESVFDRGLGDFFIGGVVPPLARDVRADIDGVRTAILVDGVKIKFEVIRESRIELVGGINEFVVPSLSRVSLFAEKLLANADRGNAADSQKKDILDLLCMQMEWGPIPDASIRLASNAYGYRVIKSAYEDAMNVIQSNNLPNILISLDILPKQRVRMISAIESGHYSILPELQRAFTP
ncbi:nucleotidyl transferase AbiEii/AbiGii toxin family protein [Methylobacillus sp. Pita2]|uniref:nucleotidyl transferase AbiEii/AbiGii toxin family protein n=1 Tax=Methylobacillus sp. Pita2 TaxID=3383245 RepID=UPI0038B590E9